MGKSSPAETGGSFGGALFLVLPRVWFRGVGSRSLDFRVLAQSRRCLKDGKPTPECSEVEADGMEQLLAETEGPPADEPLDGDLQQLAADVDLLDASFS